MLTQKKKKGLRKTRKIIKNMINVKPDIVSINGYKILLLPNKNKTIVVKAFINNGFMSESKETAGINHLLEHVLFSAWKKCNDKPCREWFHYEGLNGNATTDDMILTYYVQGINDKIDSLLEYIITITTKPYIYQELLDREKNPVLNEELIIKNKRITSLYNKLNKNLYKIEGLKYRNDSDQHIKNLETINLKKLHKVFDKHYTANNIIYTISGDYNKQKVLEKFKSLLPQNKIGKSFVFKDCLNKNMKKVIFDKDNTAKTGTILYVFPVDLYAGDKDLFKLNIVILCLQYILHKILRYKLKVTYGLSISMKTLSCGTLVIINTHSECKNIKNIYKVIDEEIEKIKIEGIKSNLLYSEKKRYIYKYINTYNNPHTIANFYGSQYIGQINNKSVKLYSIKEVKNIVLDTTIDDTKNLLNLVFNKSKAIKAYQCSTK